MSADRKADFTHQKLCSPASYYCGTSFSSAVVLAWSRRLSEYARPLHGPEDSCVTMSAQPCPRGIVGSGGREAGKWPGDQALPSECDTQLCMHCCRKRGQVSILTCWARGGFWTCVLSQDMFLILISFFRKFFKLGAWISLRHTTSFLHKSCRNLTYCHLKGILL